MIILLCGLSGAGKTTLAGCVKNRLSGSEISIEVIDADEYRQKLFTDLQYSKEDRFENLRRLGFIASKFSNQGIVTIISAINPYDSIRRELAETYQQVKVVHVDCSLDVLKARDTKGLYKRAMLPDGHPQKLFNLTGINDPFEAPCKPHLHINTQNLTIAESADMFSSFIEYHYYMSQVKSIAC
ncbi:adenylyl-sulfate kinase [Mucilaginibacter sp. SP1R1]|uniref:adenylyl-sulfate kinase n=1 Tax=Mucilaginibacter sp. SP1R1 TaxID=2723091 RepID=UPI00161DCE4D|nr:adenylyl-sulfate kinase [Mucilaginibacter sp. SP1R1]MBB6152756.1 adenylylsulfate kinase [Mucilaginibacter sp. SP1R1]